MPSNDQPFSFNGCDATPFRVLIIGGSYAGLAAATNLLDLCHGRPARFTPTEPPVSTTKIPVDITIVDERDGYYHLIGTPLALASETYAAHIWRKFSDIPALNEASGVRCIQGTVKSVNCQEKHAKIVNPATKKSYEEKYDFLIVASGLRRVWPTVPLSLTREDYLAETGAHINAVKNAQKGVVVIGGGAVGIEMAAELKLDIPSAKVTLIHSRPLLLSSEPLPEEFATVTAETLREEGVELILSKRVISTTQTSTSPPAYDLELSDGTTLPASVVISAISHSKPSTTFLPVSSLDKEGYVHISADLAFTSDTPNHEFHYAAGDLVKWSGIRRAGTAMHMGHYAAYNIHQKMLLQKGLLKKTDVKFQKLDEIPPMLGLAVGSKAVAYGLIPGLGVRAGKDVLQYMFQDDLGFNICWNYMQLGKAFEA